MERELTMTKKPNQQNTADMQKIELTGLGERLRSIREAMRLTEKEAGARLHLSPKIITIMENEDFENGPPATFIRGYLRSYARMLNIPESEINTAVANLEATIPQTPQPSAPPILKTSPRNQTHHYLRLMTFGVVAILMVLVSVWWTSHPKDLITYVKATTNTMTTATPVVATNETHAIAQPVTAAPVTQAPVAPQTQAPAVQTAPPAIAPTAPNKDTKTAVPPVNSTDTDEETPATTTPPTPVAKNTTAESAPTTTPEEPSTNLAEMGMAHPEPGLDLNDTDNNNTNTGDENNNTAN